MEPLHCIEDGDDDGDDDDDGDVDAVDFFYLEIRIRRPLQNHNCF